MEPRHHSDPNTYSLIVTRRKASEFLVVLANTGWSLPRVEISPGQRIAYQLTMRVLTEWRLRAYCLFISNGKPLSEVPQAPSYAVMECLDRDQDAPMGSFWTTRAAIERMKNEAPHDDKIALTEAVREIALHSEESATGQFAKPGWIAELLAWAEEELRPRGLRPTGDFRQFNASPTFSLVRIETNGQAVWFKATGKPNLRELPITLALAQQFPEHMPSILGVHELWNGWLSEEVPGKTLAETSELAAWERVATCVANLQISSIKKANPSLEAGCKDMTALRLLELVDPFLTQIAGLMAVQEKKSPAPLGDSELSLLACRLQESCSVLLDLNLPDTIGNIDLSPGNIVVSSERCVFLDWAEGCITSPLVMFEYLREHTRRNSIRSLGATVRVNAAYLRPWRSLVCRDDLAEALAVTPLIAVFMFALACDAWRSSESDRNSTQEAYLRSLTRRMYHEATRQASRSQSCPI